MKYKIKLLSKKDKELMKIFKTCKSCKQLKLIKEFYNDKKLKDGKSNICKKCTEERASKRYVLKCEYCGNEFYASKKKQRFCSTDCSNRYNGTLELGENNHFYGKHHTEDTKQKMKDNHVDFKGSKNPMYGKSSWDKMTEENKLKRRENQSLKMSGENHPNWNKDKTNEEREIKREYIDYYDWRKKVYERDNYTCVCCGYSKGGNLNAHHIYGYSEYKELRTDINNGITLCEKCHKLYHKKNGYNNNTLENFIMFLNEEFKKTNNYKYIEIIKEINKRF